MVPVGPFWYCGADLKISASAALVTETWLKNRAECTANPEASIGT